MIAKITCFMVAVSLCACSSGSGTPDAGCGGVLATCGLNSPCCSGLVCSPSLSACVSPSETDTNGTTGASSHTTSGTTGTHSSTTVSSSGQLTTGIGTSGFATTGGFTNGTTTSGQSATGFATTSGFVSSATTSGFIGSATTSGFIGGSTTSGFIGSVSSTGGLIGGNTTGGLIGGTTPIGGIIGATLGGLLGNTLGGTLGGIGGTTSGATPCANSSQCTDPTTYCLEGTCQTNTCGLANTLPDGGQNGVYDGTCYTGESPQGTCAPSVVNSANIGLCIQNGPLTSNCNYDARTTECEPPTLCIMLSTAATGNCDALCDPNAPSCASGTYCISFGAGQNPQGGYCGSEADCQAQNTVTTCGSGVACQCGQLCADAGPTLGALCEQPCSSTSQCLDPTAHCASGAAGSSCMPVPCTGAVGSTCNFTSANSQDGTCVNDSNGNLFCIQSGGRDAGCDDTVRTDELCQLGLACSLDDGTCEAVCDATGAIDCTDGISTCTQDTGTDYGVCEGSLL